MDKKDKILVCGAFGMVGRSIVLELKNQGYYNILTPSKKELDLTDINALDNYFINNKPDYLVNAAAKVGGIIANIKYPVDMLSVNLSIQLNLIKKSYENNLKKVLFLGSSCIYPKYSKQPILEDYLLSGSLEDTNEFYALSKIAGIKLCQAYRKQYNCNFISAMPTNVYGPFDNFNLEDSHVIPGLMHRIHLAKENNLSSVQIWGTGEARREFIHVDDLAKGCIFLLKKYDEYKPINIGTGKEVKIKELAEIICKIVNYKGELVFDTTKPDGTPRKLLDTTKMSKLGWVAEKNFLTGLNETYKWFVENKSNIRT